MDFFTPVVDDPYRYGAIAAANALSDVFAMGGTVLTAMSIVAFPSCLPTAALGDILRGGVDKVHEAGGTMMGGHSIEDDEPKFGLAVTGTVHPQRLITSQGGKTGDLLVLTKALGTGLLTTALKAEVIGEQDMEAALAGMERLNRAASEVMRAVGVSACTDVTGFGLIGHALEMARASAVELIIHADSLPAYPHAVEMAQSGLVPVGAFRNRDYYMPDVTGTERISEERIDLLCDPQTSGGLLISVAPDKVDTLLAQLEQAGENAAIIGEIGGGNAATITLI